MTNEAVLRYVMLRVSFGGGVCDGMRVQEGLVVAVIACLQRRRDKIAGGP